MTSMCFLNIAERHFNGQDKRMQLLIFLNFEFEVYIKYNKILRELTF